jgi:hypothetical protein
MDIVLCSITKKSDPNDTVLGQSIEKIGDVYSNIETSNSGENVKGLSKYYNECLEKYSDVDYLVFVHDDVDLLFSDLSYQVYAAMQNYDVAGVAGCVNPKIVEKNLWHWMVDNKIHLRGIAGHPFDDKSFYVTSFGPTPSRVAILDGVFLAVNVKKLIETGIRFDEQFMFHHYDIDFSFSCNKNKLKLGTWPFLINHQSPGLREFNESWNKSNEKFINKWKKN